MREQGQLFDGALGGQVEPGRRADDFYETPRWVIDAALDATGLPGDAATVLDAGAGLGVLARAVVQRSPAIMVTAVELNIERAAQLRQTTTWFVEELNMLALGGGLWRVFDLVVANPPFSTWAAFTHAALECLEPGGDALIVGFVNVLGSVTRSAFWRRWAPHLETVYVCRRRPCFTSDGKHDPRDCAVFHFVGAPTGARRLDWIG